MKYAFRSEKELQEVIFWSLVRLKKHHYYQHQYYTMLYNENPNIKLRSTINLLVKAKYTEKTVYVMHKPNALLINIATNFEYIFYSFHSLYTYIVGNYYSMDLDKYHSTVVILP